MSFVLKINHKVIDGNVMSSIQTPQWERHREARENEKRQFRKDLME